MNYESRVGNFCH